jgi:oligoribonuclease
MQAMTAHTPPAVASAGKAMTLKKSDQNLVWLDCEMTGLDPKQNRLIEIAVVVTSADLGDPPK